MIISGVNMTQGISGVGGVSSSTGSFANVGMVNSDSDMSTMEISDTGKRMGNMMDRMGQMPPPPKEKMTEMKSSIEELNLDELDLDSMTEEEISDVADEIDAVMESFKPEDMPSGVDVSSMTAEEKYDFVSEFKNNADGVLESLGKMEGMAEGQPPMGGKPPKGAGGMGGANSQAISAYESLSVEEDDDEDMLDMIESLMEALEADELSEDTDSNEFYKVVGDYLSQNLNA